MKSIIEAADGFSQKRSFVATKLGLGYDFFGPIYEYANKQKTVRHRTVKVLP
jgi:hypothetical protein